MIVEKKVLIKNKSGLHARPAAIFVQIANKYDCEITVKKGKQKVNGKSIMGIMKKLQHEAGITFLIVSHNTRLKKYMDRTLILRHGKLHEGS